MSASEEQPNQTRLALATLTACIAKALGESDPKFLPGLEKHLEEAYYFFRETEATNVGVMETLKWTLEIIRGR